MRVPFPDVSSNLAAQAHMYVCIRNGTHKEFIKCQRFKPKHLNKKIPPYQRIEEMPNINRNPFNSKTILDCDKSFYIKNVVVDKSLLAAKRKDVCEELYTDIKVKIKHNLFSINNIDITSLLSLNNRIKVKS